MESTRLPRQSGRRTFPSRPRSRIYLKKQSIVKRVASTLRRRRSQLHFMYQNALIEMAESKLNLPHEGQPGLIYAVSEIPTGHSRQSLIDVFDDVVASMSASTTKSSGQRSWATCRTSHDTRSGHSMDLLTGDYNTPEDFDYFLTWKPLRPRPIQQSSKTDEGAHEPAELSWSPPRTPSRTSNESLIDLTTPTSTGLPTPPNAQSLDIDELFFGGLSEALASPPLLPNQSLASLDATLFPQPLDFKDSPYPVVRSPRLSTPKTLQKRAVHGNLRLDTQHPALQVVHRSPIVKTQTPIQPGQLIPRKPVSIRHQKGLTPATPTPYRPYRAALPSPQLPPLLTPATDSLLEEMKSAIDRVMDSFNPAATSKEPPRNAPRPPTASPNTPIPHTHRILIPPRTTSRSATATTTTTTTTPNPHISPPTTPNPQHAPSSFRTRLGASTLNALLRASDAASPSPPSSSPTPTPTITAAPYSWHRWVDQMRDPDSETEEREYSRWWRERKRRGDGRVDGSEAGLD